MRAARGRVALRAGVIIGAGIFVLTGVVAQEQAGPAVALSVVIAGIAIAAAGCANGLGGHAAR